MFPPRLLTRLRGFETFTHNFASITSDYGLADVFFFTYVVRLVTDRFTREIVEHLNNS